MDRREVVSKGQVEAASEMKQLYAFSFLFTHHSDDGEGLQRANSKNRLMPERRHISCKRHVYNVPVSEYELEIV